jgi:broad specificity phosphatase PhoE
MGEQEVAKGPTVVLFVRHGTTPTTGKVLPGQGGGLHLADSGRADAKLVAERIAALPAGRVTAVYASNLERAIETAEPIAAAVGHEILIEPDLADCDVGEWTGRDLKELRELPLWKEMERWPSGFRFPGGESFAEVQGRVAGVVARLRERHPGEVVVAVSHADPIKLAVGSALGSPPDQVDRVSVSPCSVTPIAYGTPPRVLAVNSTADLSSLDIVRPASADAAAGGASSESDPPAGVGRDAAAPGKVPT